jgi:mannose-1-phosphate guanylyltransferase
LSRSHRPKQLLPLLSDRSLVQATVDRVLPLVPAERVLIVTEMSHADDLRAQLPQLPSENILIEPARRGTAAAVGLAATVIAHRDPEATMASLHSDAAVLDADGFRLSLAAAFELARSDDWLVTLGIQPSHPHVGMGYIQVGDGLGAFAGVPTHRAMRFVEKPDHQTAARFIGEGYVWNPGMFIWRVSVILERFAELLPQTHQALLTIGESLGTSRERAVLEQVYPSIPVQSIDVGIMEKAQRVATIPSDFGWSDVGSWGEILAIAPKDGNGNVVRGDHVGIDTARTLIFGQDRPVFTLGVEDLVIVSLPDAVLVCHRDRAEEVRRFVDGLQADPARADLL